MKIALVARATVVGGQCYVSCPKRCALLLIFLRVILSLENAWTAEKKYGHEVLPEKHTILKRALGEVWGLEDDQGQPLKHVELAFGMLNTEKVHDLCEAVFSLVREQATVEPY